MAQQANKFATFVGEYFYPLLNGVDTPKEFLDLVGRDSALLAATVQVGSVKSSACL